MIISFDGLDSLRHRELYVHPSLEDRRIRNTIGDIIIAAPRAPIEAGRSKMQTLIAIVIEQQ